MIKDNSLNEVKNYFKILAFLHLSNILRSLKSIMNQEITLLFLIALIKIKNMSFGLKSLINQELQKGKKSLEKI